MGKTFFSQLQSRKVHGEMWAGLLKKHGPRTSQEVEIVPVCAAIVVCPSSPDNSLEPPGPGRWVGHNWRKPFGLGYGCSGVPSKERIFFSSLVAAGDWVRKGSYHTACPVPSNSSCTCSYAYGARPRYRAQYWRAVLATARRYLEGCRSPDEALVC